MHLLDTNIMVGLLNRENAVIEGVGKLAHVSIPSTVLGELYFGALRSSMPEQNLAKLEVVAATSPVIACDAGTAKEYGRVKSELLRIGRPIPENDIWIAGLALQYDATLVTRDSHFSHVSGLKLESM